MAPAPRLHAGFERLIGTAFTDPSLKQNLLRDPRATALQFGLTGADAEMVSDIHVKDLRAFATVLMPRLYGRIDPRVGYSAAVAG
jgi:hypothetical protein